MAAREENGAWGSAQEVPGAVADSINTVINFISCAPGGKCAAVGNDDGGWFVVSQS